MEWHVATRPKQENADRHVVIFVHFLVPECVAGQRGHPARLHASCDARRVSAGDGGTTAAGHAPDSAVTDAISCRTVDKFNASTSAGVRCLPAAQKRRWAAVRVRSIGTGYGTGTIQAVLPGIHSMLRLPLGALAPACAPLSLRLWAHDDGRPPRGYCEMAWMAAGNTPPGPPPHPGHSRVHCPGVCSPRSVRRALRGPVRVTR